MSFRLLIKHRLEPLNILQVCDAAVISILVKEAEVAILDSGRSDWQRKQSVLLKWVIGMYYGWKLSMDKQ